MFSVGVFFYLDGDFGSYYLGLSLPWRLVYHNGNRTRRSWKNLKRQDQGVFRPLFPHYSWMTA